MYRLPLLGDSGSLMSRFRVNTMESDNLRRLENALVKFHSYKRNNTSKTNILRLSLLPFLRNTSAPWSAHRLDAVDPRSRTQFLELAVVLLRWWKALLSAVKELHQMTSIDRNCYLEAISRIVGRQEWLEIAKDPNSEIYKQHNAQLLETFEFCIARLDVKNINLPINAFVGKIFAHAFVKLPDLSRGILFLLNSRVKNYKEYYDLMVREKSPHQPVPGRDKKYFEDVVNATLVYFPQHLHPLIKSAEQPRQTRYKLENKVLNSVSPPSAKITGISDPRGLWCTRWSSLENVDLFCSFLRHYLTLISFYVQQTKSLSAPEVYALPGFAYLITHIFEIVDFQIFQSAQRTCSQSTESQVDKLLKLLRDFLANARHEFEPSLRSGVLKCFDTVFKLVFYKTTIFQTERIDLCFDIWVRFVRSIDETNSYATQDLDWKFWIDTLFKLLNSEFINSELKALSVLYQIWDYLPSSKPPQANWVSDPNDTLKYNMILYLTSSDNWSKFFGHYLPLVRCYFIILMVWKVLGLESLHLSTKGGFADVMTGKKVQAILQTRLDQSYSASEKIPVVPTDPLLNKKLAIVSAGPRDDPSKRDLVRSHPYEILDDAIYTCANLSVGNSTTSLFSSASYASTTSMTSKRSKLASHWVSKFFKKKDSDVDSTQSESVNIPPPTAVSGQSAFSSQSSLLPPSTSSLTLSSKSSSPSILSSATTYSSPQSSLSSVEFIDTSNEPNSRQNLPVELLMRPPELGKSVYKFQLVVNENKIHDSLKQLQEFNVTKFNSEATPYYNAKPKLPGLGLNICGGSICSDDDIDMVSQDSRSLDFQFRSAMPVVTAELALQPLPFKATYTNAIYEYNKIAHEFEQFVKQRLDSASGTSTPTDAALYLFSDSLAVSIPVLLSEAPEKPNAY
ncbi:hypothetical protein KL905_001609 [Ogataea polymorpha]|uniref:Uncharacterized protein n=2 Tax=Ogataea polymorpha TaxID=460523 RepID=A0A9P8P4S6_9ASCO|nr:hypothetical protein KL937_000080 [Ogataea polymorpha]KAG7904331.1 hypothetical protein KL935_000470 [Ogataea polymorpha]KAG7908167.1 hypothetical protein KL907_001657 [Ogataea polymorpha]KAG7922388.1 hypothetical protein KL905_001609 [Ogataea polymorpha]KAG7939144.1 hypothetical protein KL934_000078 [Ogataea polymorpha]